MIITSFKIKARSDSEIMNCTHLRIAGFFTFLIVCSYFKTEFRATASMKLIPGVNTVQLSGLLESTMLPGDSLKVKFKQTKKTNKVKLRFQGANFESDGEDLNVTLTGYLSEVTFQIDSTETSDAEISFTFTSLQMQHVSLGLQLVLSVALLVLWQHARPHAVAGVALTSLLQSISTMYAGEKSSLVCFFYGFNISTTIITWRILITHEHPTKLEITLVGIFTVILCGNRLSDNDQLKVVSLCLLAAFIVKFIPFLRQVND